jgi:hypothetical protein
MRAWHVLSGDIREDTGIASEILEFIEQHGALSVAMTGGIIGCPHEQELITTGNGARFASSGMDATASRARCSIDQRKLPTPVGGHHDR